MKRTKFAAMATTTLISLVSAFAAPASAQLNSQQQDAVVDNADNSKMIIVTARLREENLQETPLSIQAITSEDIEASGIADLADLANFAPGIAVFENTDRGYGQVFLRGMASTPPVGDTSRELASVFIDGIYYVGGISGINTDGIERVEVVKGPQSALFGRSTFSGAINFITKKPTDTWSGNVSSTLATDGEFEASGSLAGPIIDDVLGIRVSGRYRDFDGQYRNQLNGQRIGQERDYSLSGKLFFTPSDSFKMSLSASYLNQNDGAPSTVLTGKQPIHNFTSASGSTFFQGVLPGVTEIEQNVFPDTANILDLNTSTTPFSFDPFTDFGRLPLLRNGLKREFLFTSWDAAYEFPGGYSLSYLGGYSSENAGRLYDFEFSEEENYFGARTTDSDSHSHELRFSSPDDDRFRWLVGAFYLRQDLFERDPGGIFGEGVFGRFGLMSGQVVVRPGPRTIVDLQITNSALFGSASFDITDQFTISLEGRYQNDELEDPNFPKQSTKAFLPRAILEYQANDDVLLYAVASKGLRPTVINSQFIARTEAEQAALRVAFPTLVINDTAPKEEIWSYEIGAKTTLLDGRLIFNVNGYYSDWSDRQNLQSLLFDFGAGIQSTLVTVNGSDVKAYGIELQSSVQVTPEWTAGVNFAWNKTELSGDGSDAIISRFFLDNTVNGQRLPQTPEFSGTFITEYRNQFGNSDVEYFLRGEAIYVGSRFASTLNLTETGDSIDVNLRAGIETDHFGISLFVENLFQDRTFESLRSNADCATTSACSLRAYEVVLPRKRQFGVTLKGKF